MAVRKGFLEEMFSLLQRLVFTTIILYLFFAFNSLYALTVLDEIFIPALVLYVIYQCLILLVGFCFFRMSIAKNCTTLELFPAIEEKEESSSEESLHLNPFEKDNLYVDESEMNICTICKTPKPTRSHHCKKCNRCLLLMYKHLDWVDICIGFTNYKFYIVFLFYSVILSILGILAFTYSLSYGSIAFSEFNDMDMTVPMIIALVAQGIFLVGISYELVVAVYSVLINQTPEERKHPPEDKRISYDLGMYTNWKTIMGPKWYMWFLPMWSTSGDGIKYTSTKKIDLEASDLPLLEEE
ncbi:palmitoyltransferase ZDHHC2/15/20 [Nematocida sp. AWRm77]|nr:palmitoyltransferase ZDHHC2/15/20 [Nematocida sp. AWRm77]